MNVCVFGSASDKIDAKFIEAGERLGENLAKRGHKLVFGAGAQGMMGAVARGFKYRLTLNNTVGIIDSDYYHADNEGHIYIKMTNCGNQPLLVEKGKAFAQGVFVEYGITVDDECDSSRHGGFGSTDK